uniref:Uncharacterized protein n=1 Tax=Arundo donax TaxID=35708 RepID=A0A0A8YRV9_ARUDO
MYSSQILRPYDLPSSCSRQT